MGVAFADRGESPKIADAVGRIGRHPELELLTDNGDTTFPAEDDNTDLHDVEFEDDAESTPVNKSDGQSEPVADSTEAVDASDETEKETGMNPTVDGDDMTNFDEQDDSIAVLDEQQKYTEDVTTEDATNADEDFVAETEPTLYRRSRLWPRHALSLIHI